MDRLPATIRVMEPLEVPRSLEALQMYVPASVTLTKAMVRVMSLSSMGRGYLSPSLTISVPFEKYQVTKGVG